MHNGFENTRLNRAAFLAGTLAAGATAAAPQVARSAAPAAPAGHASPQELLGRLMAGNQRFVNNDFPKLSMAAEKREALVETQAPFAAIVSCSDSRVIPNFVFVQGMGDLFVVRLAGNFPDDAGIGSLEYAIEHLGTRLIMVLGHENCGAVKAVYEAIQANSDLPAHLIALERLMAPGMTGVVRSHGTMRQANEANVRAASERVRTSAPIISEAVDSGKALVVGGYYHLASGEVTVIR